jgi:hypothetical protein
VYYAAPVFTTSIFLLFDSVFVGSFRKALAPVNGRIIDVLVGVFLAITLGSASHHENDYCSSMILFSSVAFGESEPS